MLTEFLVWWIRQMLDLLPQSWRPSDAGPRRALVIACDHPTSSATATCLRRRSHREMPIGQLNLTAADSGSATHIKRGRNEPVVLRLPFTPLERDVTLPLVAEMAAERVLEMELDRLTPFAASDVFWSWRVVRRDPARGRLHALVSMVPRTALLPLLTALQQHGLVPEVLENMLPNGTMRRIALTASRPRRLRTLVIAGCIAFAIIVAVATPLLMQRTEAADLDRRIAELKPQVDRIEALRRLASGGAVDADIVRGEQRRVGDVAQVLATLTDLMPDDTYLTAFAMRQRQLTISGQSNAAPRLIETLSGGPLIRSPAFTAPVLHDQGSGVDTFSLRAELAP